MPVARVRCTLTGLVQGGGLSTFNFAEVAPGDNLQANIQAVSVFWDTIKTEVSSGVTIKIEGAVDILDEVTGDLVGTYSGVGDTKTGTASGNAMPPANQRLLRLRTNEIAGGKRILGKLYIPGAVIPSSDTQTVPLPVRTKLEVAGDGLASASGITGGWCVWSRKNGQAYTIKKTSAWDKYAILRSRRD